MPANVSASQRGSAPAGHLLERLRDKVAWKVFGLRLRRETLRNQAFDAKHGTDTAAETPLIEAGLSAADAERGNTVYRVFWERNFQAIIDDIDIDHTSYTFVDIGSGKGKLLLLASLLPFKRVLGVELAPLLHEIALSNIVAFHSPSQRCANITSLLGDALSFELPDGPLFCLMVNPFDEITLRRVMARIADQRLASQHPVFVVYANMRRIEERASVFDDPGNLAVLMRQRNHIILGNPAAARLAHSNHRRPAATLTGNGSAVTITGPEST